MKSFAFRYSPVVWILLIAVASIFAASTAINVYDAAVFFAEFPAKFALAVTLAAFSAAVFTLTVAAAAYSRYVIKGKYLYFRFGLFFVKTEIGKIFQLTEFKAQRKLVIYFTDEKYSVAMISEKNYQAFYLALKSVNPDIIFTVHTADGNE